MVCPIDSTNALPLLALVNSSVLKYYYLNRFGDKRADFPKIKGTYLAKLPIPDVANGARKQLEKLVERRLVLTATATDERQHAEAEAIEQQIDQVVYGLYGLTAAEVALVEGSAVAARGRGKGGTKKGAAEV